MGAASATLISDPALLGSDALTTAKLLAAAIRDQDIDLVIAGSESSDGYTGTVPAQLAGVLDLPSISAAKAIVVDGDKVRVQRQTNAGYDDVECSMPCVISVTAGVVEPRYPSFKGIMAAKSKPVEERTAADLGFDASDVGWAGAGQEIVEIARAPQREAGEIVEDDGEGHLKIVEFLENLKVI
jgi:electron transfer flavoprotein beta subunit